MSDQKHFKHNKSLFDMSNDEKSNNDIIDRAMIDAGVTSPAAAIDVNLVEKTKELSNLEYFTE